jgi:hypothetical protein
MPALGAVIFTLTTDIGLAQLPGTRVPGGCDVPVTQRTSDTGCYLTATLPLPPLPAEPIFWHVYSLPSRSAADAVEKQPASIVVESLGAQCLRTPDATTILRQGEGGFVAAGPPMMLTSLGPGTRRSLVLVLHDSEEPWMTVTTDWRPVTGCPEN